MAGYGQALTPFRARSCALMAKTRAGYRDAAPPPDFAPWRVLRRAILLQSGLRGYAALRHEPKKHLRIDVAAGEDRNHDLAPDVEAARHQRRERNRAARLDHEFQFTKRKADRGGDFLVGRNDTLADQRAIDRESQHA